MLTEALNAIDLKGKKETNSPKTKRVTAKHIRLTHRNDPE